MYTLRYIVVVAMQAVCIGIARADDDVCDAPQTLRVQRATDIVRVAKRGKTHAKNAKTSTRDRSYFGAIWNRERAGPMSV